MHPNVGLSTNFSLLRPNGNITLRMLITSDSSFDVSNKTIGHSNLLNIDKISSHFLLINIILKTKVKRFAE